MKVLARYMASSFIVKFALSMITTSIVVFLIDTMTLLQHVKGLAVLSLAIKRNYLSVQSFLPLIITIAACLHYNLMREKSAILAVMSFGGKKQNMILPVFLIIVVFFLIHIFILLPLNRNHMECGAAPSSVWVRGMDNGERVVVKIDDIGAKGQKKMLYKGVTLVYPEKKKVIKFKEVLVGKKSWYCESGQSIDGVDGAISSIRCDGSKMKPLISQDDVINSFESDRNIFSLARFILGGTKLNLKLSTCKINVLKQYFYFFISTLMLAVVYKLNASPDTKKKSTYIAIYFAILLQISCDNLISFLSHRFSFLLCLNIFTLVGLIVFLYFFTFMRE